MEIIVPMVRRQQTIVDEAFRAAFRAAVRDHLAPRRAEPWVASAGREPSTIDRIKQVREPARVQRLRHGHALVRDDEIARAAQSIEAKRFR